VCAACEGRENAAGLNIWPGIGKEIAPGLKYWPEEGKKIGRRPENRGAPAGIWCGGRFFRDPEA
jgi:hypothetical protein